jgi:hypothetical protein
MRPARLVFVPCELPRSALTSGNTGRVASPQSGGGYEIRTREGLPPTRFPSVRPRPLGESSKARGYARWGV